MKRPTILLPAAIVVATLVVAYVWSQLRDERTRGADLITRISALESVSQHEPAPPVAPAVLPQPEPAPAAQSVPGLPAARPARIAAVPAAAVAEPAPVTPSGNAMLEAMRAPGAMDATRSMVRAMMNDVDPDLEAELGLSADEAKRFHELLATQLDDSMEVAMGLMEAGPPGSAARGALLRQIEEKERADDAQQSAMLGSRYAKWQDYQHVRSARSEIQELRALLSTGGHPLTDAQAQQLQPVIAVEQRRIHDGERSWMNSPAAVQAPNLVQASMTRAVEAQQGIVEVASRHLTAAQAELYRKNKERELAMLRSMMGMFGGGGAPPSGMAGGRQ